MATRSSSHPDQSSPSFFKVIRHPSAAHLSLPNAFVRRYLEKIPKNPILVTATGNHSWRMKFVKIGEDYCFAHGWEDLVNDVGLCSRDIVVFWLIDSFTFHVTFLGANGCEKHVPVIKTNDVDDGEYHDKNLWFEKVFGRKSLGYYMPLPVKFVKAAGLEHKQHVKLKDHEGREWPMGIIVQRYTSPKYGLSAGWAVFRKYHNLSEGDVGTFTFDKQQGVIKLTRLFKSKRPIKQETQMEEVNRNNGTHSCYGYGNGNVKIEDEWSPTEKPCGGGCHVKVKTEYESGSKMEVVKRKRGAPQLKTYANVKIEDGWVQEMVPPEKPSRGVGVEVNTEPEMESMFQIKRVVYF
ncbi:putative transcription factor B3-Domain family [Helianthus annuus]|nr:putative transcription factor B3-Domain family [Helianthus annuus]KAJ0631895.1 putative transcription factor B3-Domain family [Helianthus annuus]KAJ0635790.1 putative transcription factor B3-Domain family [Helianthus annuus]